MQLRIFALYPAVVHELQGQPGVLLRRGREGLCTLVDCDIVTENGCAFARPRHAVPGGTPAPMFRAHLAIAQHEIPKRGVAVVVQPDDRKTGIDPEQRLLAPMFVSEDRIRFEFQRGEVVFVSPKGEVEIRLVAVLC